MGQNTPPLARRIKAARTYSGKSRAQLGQLVGRSAEQIGRYERGDWLADPPGVAMLEAIARHTDVPMWFLNDGFDQDGDARQIGGGVPPIPGETGRRIEDHQPTDQDREQQGSDQGTGSR